MAAGITHFIGDIHGWKLVSRLFNAFGYLLTG